MLIAFLLAALPLCPCILKSFCFASFASCTVLDVIRRGTAGHLPSTPRPIYSHTTGWLQDPFARGSYSFAPHHVHHHRLQQALAKPLHGLFFAGEALDRLDSQTVHGAVSSACAAANRIREAALALALPAVPSSPSLP